MIHYHCEGCKTHWYIAFEELRLGESHPMTETCPGCELTYCGICYDEHPCFDYQVNPETSVIEGGDNDNQG